MSPRKRFRQRKKKIVSVSNAPINGNQSRNSSGFSSDDNSSNRVKKKTNTNETLFVRTSSAECVTRTLRSSNRSVQSDQTDKNQPDDPLAINSDESTIELVVKPTRKIRSAVLSNSSTETRTKTLRSSKSSNQSEPLSSKVNGTENNEETVIDKSNLVNGEREPERQTNQFESTFFVAVEADSPKETHLTHTQATEQSEDVSSEANSSSDTNDDFEIDITYTQKVLQQKKSINRTRNAILKRKATCTVPVARQKSENLDNSVQKMGNENSSHDSSEENMDNSKRKADATGITKAKKRKLDDSPPLLSSSSFHQVDDRPNGHNDKESEFHGPNTNGITGNEDEQKIENGSPPPDNLVGAQIKNGCETNSGPVESSSDDEKETKMEDEQDVNYEDKQATDSQHNEQENAIDNGSENGTTPVQSCGTPDSTNESPNMIPNNIEKNSNDEGSDDEILDLFETEDVDDLLGDIGHTSPIVQMNVPNWKKAKPVESNSTTQIASTSNVSRSNDIAIKARLKTLPNQQKPKMVNEKKVESDSVRVTIQNNIAIQNGKSNASDHFKIGRVSNLDPRVAKKQTTTVSQNLNGNIVSQTANQPQPSTSNAFDAQNVPRVSVKDRLGVRQQNINMNQMHFNAMGFNVLNMNPSLIAPPPNITTIADIPNLPQTLQTLQPSMLNRENLQVTLPPPNAHALSQQTKRKTVELIRPAFDIGPKRYKPAFGYLFDGICRRSMNDGCPKTSNQCEWSHNLPDGIWFTENMDKCEYDEIFIVYDFFMKKNPKLFAFYFAHLAFYFAKHKKIDQLKQMVQDCIDRKQLKFFSTITDALMSMGLSYSKSLAELTNSVKSRSTDISKILIKLILDPRNTSINTFISVLESISIGQSNLFMVDSANRLLRIYDEKRNVKLIQTIFNLTANDKLTPKLDQELLTRFLTNSTADLMAQRN